MLVKNIIIINDYSYTQGGASKVAIDTANLLSDYGFNVFFVCAVSNDSKELNPRIKVFSSSQNECLSTKPIIKGIFQGIKNKQFDKLVEKVLTMFDPKDTIIHVHGWTKALSSSFFKIIYVRKFKSVLTLHDYFSICPNGGFFNFKTNIPCTLKANSFKCFTCNCDSRNYLLKMYRCFREKSYIKNINLNKTYPLFISEFQKNILNRYFVNLQGEVLINPIFLPYLHTNVPKEYDFTFIGRASAEKGFDMFIKLAKLMPNYKFLFVGDYKGEKTDNVEVTGWVPEDKVALFFEQTRILVLPSRWPEPFGLNAVKAIIKRIPLLCADNTAPSLLIKNGINGYVFSQGDMDDLFDKAKKILDINIIESGKQEVLELNYVDKLIDIYNKILNL